MKCTKCGNELKDTDVFCTNCGQKVEKVEKAEKLKCPKCGKAIKKDDKFCTSCGEKLVQEVAKIEEEKRIISAMSNDVFYCVLSLICFFGAPMISSLLIEIPGIGEILGAIVLLFPLAGLVLCIYALVKYPKSIFAKILLAIYIVIIVLIIIGIIILIIACGTLLEAILEGCESCNGVPGLYLSLIK